MVTTNLPNGVTNAANTSPLGTLIQLDPTKVHNYFEEFNLFRAADWIITSVEAGAGSATEAVADEDKGVLVLTNDDADNDSDFLQLANETFKLTSGKQCHFKSRLKVSDAIQSEFVIGLQIKDTTPLDVSDGVFFRKNDGTINVDFVIEKDNVSTVAPSIATIGSDVYFEVVFVYDGKNKVQWSINDGVTSFTGSLATTNLPDDEELTVSFGIQNGEAAAKSMSIDYIFVANER